MSNAKTPKQLVADGFGTRADLVKKIIALTGGGDDARSALMGTTNKKLLRIHEVASQVKDRFGGKSGLIDAIEKLQFVGGKANAGWRTKLEGMTVKRLLDLHHQVGTTGPNAKK